MTAGPDIVGRDEVRGSRPTPPAVRWAILVAGALVAALVLPRTDLLSSERPDGLLEPPPSPSSSPSASTNPAVSGPPRPVALWNDALAIGLPGGVRADRQVGRELPDETPFVAVRPVPEPGAGRNSLIGIVDGQLVRVDVRTGDRVEIGEADWIVDQAAAAGRVVVFRDDHLIELAIRDGRTTDPAPFPGFDAAVWTARGIVRTSGTAALLMSRVGPDNVEHLAVAWPSALVRTSQHPLVSRLQVEGRLLDVAGDWVLLLDPACPSEDCVLRTARVRPDGIDVSEIPSPTGWSFTDGPVAGHPPDVLVPVRSVEGVGFALARVATTFDAPIVIAGSNGVLLRAGLVDGPDGAVYFLGGRPFAKPDVMVWDPTVPYTVVRLYPFRVGSGARLVCVCG